MIENISENITERKRRRKKVRLTLRIKLVIFLSFILALVFFISGITTSFRKSGENGDLISVNITQLSELEDAPADLGALIDQKKSEAQAAYREKLALNKGIMVADLSSEQEKILAADSSEFTSANLTSRFSEAVFIGDSITEGLSEYGWFPDSMVYSKIGVSIGNADDLFAAAIAASPTYFFISFGLNDLSSFGSQSEAIIAGYADAIENVLTQLKDAIVYVNAIFPPESWVVSERSYYEYRDSYNGALKDMCESFEAAVFYVDSGFILENIPEYYAEDGIHVDPGFYPLWVTYLGDVAGIEEIQ